LRVRGFPTNPEAISLNGDSLWAAGLFERIFRLVDRANRTRSRAAPMMEALGGVAIALVIFYGGYQVIIGARTPGAFFSFITALLLAYQPVKSLAILNTSLQEGLAAAQRVQPGRHHVMGRVV
jgi:subfamily B ATP-binding cassette protein MsbA